MSEENKFYTIYGNHMSWNGYVQGEVECGTNCGVSKDGDNGHTTIKAHVEGNFFVECKDLSVSGFDLEIQAYGHEEIEFLIQAFSFLIEKLSDQRREKQEAPF